MPVHEILYYNDPYLLGRWKDKINCMPTLTNIDIQIGVNSSYRNNAERFRPTISYSNTFEYKTDSENYTDIAMEAAVDVWDFLLEEDLVADRIDIHYAVRLGNVTHPVPAKGVVPLAKAHRDAAQTRAEVVDRDTIENSINQIIVDLLSTARYT